MTNWRMSQANTNSVCPLTVLPIEWVELNGKDGHWGGQARGPSDFIFRLAAVLCSEGDCVEGTSHGGEEASGCPVLPGKRGRGRRQRLRRENTRQLPWDEKSDGPGGGWWVARLWREDAGAATGKEHPEGPAALEGAQGLWESFGGNVPEYFYSVVNGATNK